MRRVTWPLTGGKNCPHFWNPWPQFAYSLCHFHGATTKIKPCYRRKIEFSHYEGYKVYCACAVPRDLCIGGPLNSHVTIFDPELTIHYTTFMGLRWRLRVVFYWSFPMLKRFSVAKKVQSKSVPEMAVFRKFKGPNIKYSHRDPQKALPYPERHHLTYFAWISVQGCIGCILIEEQKISHPRGSAKSRIWEAETLKPIATKFCTPRAVQDVITHANFGEDRLRGFGVAFKMLSHYRASVWYSFAVLQRMEGWVDLGTAVTV